MRCAADIAVNCGVSSSGRRCQKKKIENPKANETTSVELIKINEILLKIKTTTTKTKVNKTTNSELLSWVRRGTELSKIKIKNIVACF